MAKQYRVMVNVDLTSDMQVKRWLDDLAKQADVPTTTIAKHVLKSAYDESVKMWRPLGLGEIIRSGDQVCTDPYRDFPSWEKVRFTVIGKRSPDPNGSVRYRRKKEHPHE